MDIKSNLRELARHVALDGLAASSKASQVRDVNRPRVHFLYCHAVKPRDVPKFDHLVGSLAREYRFVSHSDAVKAIVEGDFSEPILSFSFDDGLQSNLLAGLVLERYGAKGMFFVPTDFVGTTSVLEARRFFDYATEVDEPAMSWHDLEFLKGRGHEIGNHTASHFTLSEVSLQEATDDIARGAEVLKQRLGSCEHFAWPRGAFEFFPGALRDAVFDSGHSSCASGVRGAHVHQAKHERELCLRRDLVASYWPVRHSLYFARRSAQLASPRDNCWPT